MHLLNNRVCRYTYITVTKTGGRHPILRPWIRSDEIRGNVVMRMETQQQYNNQDRYAINLFHLEHGLNSVQSGLLPKKMDTNYFFLYQLSLKMCERVGKIIARTLSFMHQSIFRPIYIFNNDAYFFRFSRTKIPFDLFFIKILFNINKPCTLGI